MIFPSSTSLSSNTLMLIRSKIEFISSFLSAVSNKPLRKKPNGAGRPAKHRPAHWGAHDVSPDPAKQSSYSAAR